MFSSVTALRRAAAQPRTTATVHGTSSAIGADGIARLDLVIGGQLLTRHVRVPFTHAAMLRAGLELPVRTDPAGSRAMIVEWNRVRQRQRAGAFGGSHPGWAVWACRQTYSRPP